jgi:hypothetical protein
MGESGWPPEGAVRNEIAAELSRREFMRRAGGLGAGALILSALPVAARMAAPAPAQAQLALLDGTLQAFFDTIIPGKPVPGLRTERGDPIHPNAIAGVDGEHGAVYTDALALGRNPKIGFSALEPAFFADLTARSLLHGGPFLNLGYAEREAVCIAGLDFGNPDRVVWEAAAAVPFTSFSAAANVVNATRETAAGYRVMGHPGTAPHGYTGFSYRRRLNRGRTKKGYLP